MADPGLPTPPPRRIDPEIVARARLITAVTLASFALAGPARSDPPVGDPHPQAEQVFERADTDKDGKLSRGEAASLPEIAARFEELDRDRDGALSFEEFLTGYPLRPS